MSPISAMGSAAAKSSTTSMPPRAAARSSSASTSTTTRACSAVSARGVNAGAKSLRMRVWSGGSRKTTLVVWCSYSGESPKRGANSTRLSDEKRW
jgi:hypothetical protein